MQLNLNVTTVKQDLLDTKLFLKTLCIGVWQWGFDYGWFLIFYAVVAFGFQISEFDETPVKIRW